MRKNSIVTLLLSLTAVSTIAQASQPTAPQNQTAPAVQASTATNNKAEEPEELNDIGKASAAFRAGNYELAWQLLAPLEAEGNPQTLYTLAHMYNDGLGGAPHDKAKAAKNYQLVIDSTVTDGSSAKYYLGQLYLKGEGVPQNTDTAISLFESLANKGNIRAFEALAPIYLERADKGNLHAQYQLALMYQKGRGVTKDLHASFIQYQKAANQGHVISQNQLGMMYRDAQGTNQNYKLALKWFESAAKQGSIDAEVNLGLLYKNGHGVNQDYSVSLEKFTLAAEKDYAPAEYNLGLLYQGGIGVEQDIKQAIEWYTKAIEHQSPDAAYQMGTLYRDGVGMPQNNFFAINYFNVAADLNNTSSFNELGGIYQYGKLDQLVDLIFAYDNYYKAAQLGDPTGLLNAAKMLNSGTGITKDSELAFDYTEQAAKQGYAPAQLALGQYYIRTKNKEQAYLWTKLARYNLINSMKNETQGTANSELALNTDIAFLRSVLDLTSEEKTKAEALYNSCFESHYKTCE